MIVAAALSWYAETEATLERCARSLGGVCDILIALGGRWDVMPEVAGSDPLVEKQALRRGATDAGILHEVVFDEEPWESQVAKRAELMLRARTVADWIFVIDADEYVVDVAPQFLDGLAATQADVASIAGIRYPVTNTSRRRPWRRVYRASTGVTVEHAHNGYVTNDGRWLHGDPGHVTLEPKVDLSEYLLLAHDLEARTDERRVARKAYKDTRRDEDLEAWPMRVTA